MNAPKPTHEPAKPIVLACNPGETLSPAPDESLPRMPTYHQIPGVMVRNPAGGPGRPLETMDITDALETHTDDGCNGNRFCILKYVLRAGRKPNTPYEKDMRKAFWCVVRELQRLGMNPQAMLNEAARSGDPADRIVTPTPDPTF